jgi:hypothetical protein
MLASKLPAFKTGMSFDVDLEWIFNFWVNQKNEGGVKTNVLTPHFKTY